MNGAPFNQPATLATLLVTAARDDNDLLTAKGPDPGSWTRGIQQLLEEAR